MPTRCPSLPSPRETVIVALLGALLFALGAPVCERKFRKLKHQADSIRNAESFEANFRSSQTAVTGLNP